MEEQETIISESMEITDVMIQDFMKEILELEKENLYVPRAGLKDQIVELAKKKVR